MRVLATVSPAGKRGRKARGSGSLRAPAEEDIHHTHLRAGDKRRGACTEGASVNKMTASESKINLITIAEGLIPREECRGGYVNRVIGLKVKCLCKCHRRRQP